MCPGFYAFFKLPGKVSTLSSGKPSDPDTHPALPCRSESGPSDGEPEAVGPALAWVGDICNPRQLRRDWGKDSGE